jgi:hypothetical protein
VPLLAWPRGQSAMLRCAVFGDCIPFFFIPLTTVASEATGASALTCSDMFVVVWADQMGDCWVLERAQRKKSCPVSINLSR